MRVAILMAIGSPWSCDTALRLAAMGNAVHVVDFAAPVNEGDSYIGVGDATYDANLRRLREHCSGVHMLSAAHPSLRYLLAAPELSSLLRTTGADVLLTLYGGGFATLALASGFRPYVCYVVGSDVLAPQGIAKTWVNRRALAQASVVLSNGEYLARQTKKLAPRANVVPLLLGIDPETFKPGHGINTRVEVICTRGFMPVYNNEAILDAIALIPADAPDFRVTFTSPGPQLPAARERADNVLHGSLRDRVRFLGGVSRENLIELLRSSDVYVSVSRSDGTSTALLEALACGLFPVLSDIPQHHEWVLGDNAILTPLDHDRRLADAILTAATDTARRTRSRPINRKLVLDRADIHHTSQQLNTQLQRVAASPGRAA